MKLLQVEIGREESLEIDHNESNLQNQHQTEEFPVPMKEGEILDDFWLAQEDRPKSASTS
ncbi:hypothetical protein COLO4_29088 [Corchorus olitorius]|uniref:Uncharacterized protein n=1 Tax=Corchorus olitorius TaxID=93759 RepID=A0A1R3HGF7_9ROSI|nr:hypothetical protein COLO4_29088 [Corchorus olitorius]